VRLELPPLRERREDIPLLIDYFIDRFNSRQGKRITGVSDAVAAILRIHDFPGNIRELENIIEYAFVLCRNGEIETSHLPPPLRQRYSQAASFEHKGITLKELERLHIVDALRRHGGNRTAAARELGINPSTLFRKIKFLDIQCPTVNGHRHRSCAADGE
jgi:DNA-binding NtrC family response regulator